jgi:hypothetical protein
MLCTALASHPQVVIAGSPYMAAQQCGPPIEMRIQLAARCSHPSATHVGIVIHVDQPAELEQSAALSPACILLTRENRLRQFLSRKLAEATGRWTCDRRGNRKRQPIKLRPMDLWWHDIKMRRCHKRAAALFPARIETTYETLLANWPEQIAAILSHLRLPLLPLAPATFRQDQRPLATAIANYQQIALSVCRRGYSHWLD